MNAQRITYDLCRCFLSDNKTILPVHVYNSLLGYLRARDFARLAACVTDLSHDVTWGKEVLTILYQVEAMFKKNRAFTDPYLSRLAAFISFEEGEEICEETNLRLDRAHVEDFERSFRREISVMQRFIDEVLGKFPDFLNELPELIKVTSGASAQRSRRESVPFMKLSKRLRCSPGALPYLNSLSVYFGYGELGGLLSSANRVEFVPKSWKTDRTIACEPEGNMFLQLAFDGYVKRSLRVRGIDLSNQTRNQSMAKEGSINGKFATIDLSMASDTLAYNTVALLLPWKWFQFLRSIRSSKGHVASDLYVDYAKFSSMGNGATFVLETLVFAAACKAVGSREFVVYGDDIVIESHLSEKLMTLLAFLGFIPNTEKSFTQGPVRESCGTLWYKGDLITPRFVREVDKRKSVLCHLVNTMMTISKPYGELWDYLRELTLEYNLPFVPINEDSMSGVWLDACTSHSKKLLRYHDRTSRWTPKFKAYKPKTSRKRNWDSRSLFLWHLNAPRRRLNTVRYRISKQLFLLFEFSDTQESSWYNTSSHKYVRKWVHWFPSGNTEAGVSDLTMFVWSEFIVRES